jgi:hypothetical protein
MILSHEDIQDENLMYVAKKISTFTPLLCYKEQNRMVPVSSGLFLKFRKNRFLVTAAHTHKQYSDKGLGIFFKKTFVTIGSSYVLSSPEDTEGDRIDICAYNLSDEFLVLIGDNFSFFDLESINTDFVNDPKDLMLIFGHPLTRIAFNERTKKVTSAPFIFRTDSVSEESIHKKLCVKKFSHQLLFYDKSRIRKLGSDSRAQGPKPNGLSGCGVWHLSEIIVPDPESIHFRPTGILIEYFEEHKAFVITRLNVISEILRNKFNIDLPKSKTVSFEGFE